MFFRRVMFASDGSSESLKAAEALARIVSPHQETSVTVVVALPGETASSANGKAGDDVNTLRQRAERALSSTGAVFSRYGIPHENRLVTGDCACTAVAAAAQIDLCDVIAMGCREYALSSDGTGTSNLTSEVMQRASVPVLVIPAP